MNLADGLQQYRKNTKYWQLTLDVERAAQRVIVDLQEYRSQPPPSAVVAAKELLLLIEKWKAMCLKSRMKNAASNSERTIWNAFQEAVCAHTDLQSINSIMQLRGFGSSSDADTGQHRAKLATAALRFLKPEEWGVVDWRTIAMLTELGRCGWNVDAAIQQAKKTDARILRRRFDLVNDGLACSINQRYRDMRAAPELRRAADVDMALFGLSQLAWRL